MARVSSLKVSKVLTAICQQQLGRLKKEIPDIQGLLLATVDGFQIAFEWHDPTAAGRLSAMTSAIHALAATLTREASAGHCQSLILNGADARVLVIDVPYQGPQPLLLTLLVNLSADLAKLSSLGHEFAQELGHKFALAH